MGVGVIFIIIGAVQCKKANDRNQTIIGGGTVVTSTMPTVVVTGGPAVHNNTYSPQVNIYIYMSMYIRSTH